jgi:ribosomal-protein-alanine N-acetyltransferase
MTTFSIRAFTGEDAEAVGTWRYPPPYGVYDLREDPEQEDDMRTAANWGVSWFAVDDGDGELIGYVELHDLDGEVELGLGMRPDRTGLGLGAAFVEAAMAFARDRWATRSFGLDVFPWNERAIRSYERAGFSRGEIYIRRFDDGNEVTFLRMGRRA